MDTELLNRVVYGNPLSSWMLALGVFVAGFAALAIARHVLLRRLEVVVARTKNDLDDLFVDLLRRTRYFFLLLLAMSAGVQALALPVGLTGAVRVFTVVALALQIGIWGNGLISFALSRYAVRRGMLEGAGAMTVGIFEFLSRLLLWGVILILALDNLGQDVTTLIAGLGIGGIAIALAVQNVLGDLFAALSIVIDKPFVIGDFIVVDSFSGTVEHIGLKSTRVRSLGGEQLVFANAELLRARISNFQRMTQRRVAVTIGVTYQTPRATLERIPGIIREVVEATPRVRFERSHFKGFAAFSLDFETVYWVLSPDYLVHMDAQQRINLELVERFAAEGIEFAHPTQTLLVQGQPGDGGRQPLAPAAAAARAEARAP